MQQIQGIRANGDKLTFSFSGVPLSVACEEISDVAGVDVFCSAEIAQTPITEYFALREVGDILFLLAKSNGFELQEIRGVYFLSQAADDSANVPRVYRLPPGESVEVLSAVKSCLSETGTCNVTGSVVVVVDALAVHDRLDALFGVLHANLSTSYLCDVYFLRLKYNDYINLSAELEVDSSLDLLEGGFDVEELFSLYASGDLSNGKNRVDQRPALLLSDGQKTTLTVGSEIVKEKKQVSAEGYSSTSGYERFQDGLELSLTPRKLDNGLIALDLDLSISTFDQSETGGDSSVVPKSDKSSLVTKGLVVRDGRLNYVGSIDRRDESKGLGLFTLSRTRNADVVTIWARVREVKN